MQGSRRFGGYVFFLTLISERAQELKSGARHSLRILASPSTALVAVPRAGAALVMQFPAARLFVETFEVRAGQMACALAAAGAGIAIVDDLTARAYRDEDLDLRPITGSPSFGIFAVAHAGFAPSEIAKRFIKQTAESLTRVGRS